MNFSRRSALKGLGIAAAAVVSAGRSRADTEPGHLDVKDPAAVALGYVEHVSDVDVKKYPDFSLGDNCENCLQLQGTAGNNYRPCGLFPGKLVSVSGWCKGWTPEI
jgi:High potential iron-sulfur protein